MGNENEGTSNFPFFPFAFSLRDSWETKKIDFAKIKETINFFNNHKFYKNPKRKRNSMVVSLVVISTTFFVEKGERGKEKKRKKRNWKKSMKRDIESEKWNNLNEMKGGAEKIQK